MTNTYVSGSLVRVQGRYADITGAAADPTTPTLKFRAGAGTTTTLTPVKDATGSYHYDIDSTGWTGPGNLRYAYQFTGTGAVQAIGSSSFEVEPPEL
jgi:hypothetical protein